MNKIAYMTCVLSLAFTMQACDEFSGFFSTGYSYK